MIAPSTITVQITVNRSVKETWWLWTEPMHIIKWNAASDDWETTFSENNLQTGGSFVSRMEAKDGSVGFDFGGTYTLVVPYERIEYTMGDGRNVKVVFRKNGQTTLITEEFVPETVHSHEMQKAGWQSILNNFKKYAETNF